VTKTVIEVNEDAKDQNIRVDCAVKSEVDLDNLKADVYENFLLRRGCDPRMQD